MSRKVPNNNYYLFKQVEQPKQKPEVPQKQVAKPKQQAD